MRVALNPRIAAPRVRRFWRFICCLGTTIPGNDSRKQAAWKTGLRSISAALIPHLVSSLDLKIYTSRSRHSNGIIPSTCDKSASTDEDGTEPMAVGIMPIPYSSNLPLPSSTHISMTNAPDSTFLMGVVLTPPKSLPLMNPGCASPSFRFLCFCNPGSAAIHGVSGPNGG